MTRSDDPAAGGFAERHVAVGDDDARARLGTGFGESAA